MRERFRWIYRIKGAFSLSKAMFLLHVFPLIFWFFRKSGLPTLSGRDYAIGSYADNTILEGVDRVLLTISKKLCPNIYTGDDFIESKLSIIALILMIPN